MSGTDDDAGVDGGASDHGFDVARRVARLREAGLYRDLQPTDAVDSAAYFAPDPGGDLPVLSGERELVFVLAVGAALIAYRVAPGRRPTAA